MVVKKLRPIIFAIIAGFLFGFCYIAGAFLEEYRILDWKRIDFYGQWLQATAAIAVFVYFLWDALDRLTDRLEKKAGESKKEVPIPINFITCMVVMLLLWIPAWLSIFPGAFAYDAKAEWEQVSTGVITSHHPVIHVVVMGGLVEGLHNITGSYNFGIGVFTLLQMVMLSAVLSKLIQFLEEFGVPKNYRLLTLLFFGLSPVTQLYAVSATKDVPFTAVMLLFLMELVRVFSGPDSYFHDKKRRACFCLTSLGVMILRNNGLYIGLIMLLIVGLYCWKLWKKTLPVLAAIFLVYLIYVGPFYSLLSAQPGGVEEKLSVPIQQLARVMSYNFDTLDEEDMDVIYRILPPDYVELYDADCADFVKKGFQRDAYEENKGAFYKIWLKWGISHPDVYLNSILLNTVDFWYPNAVVDGYSGARGYCSYFDYQVSEPGTEHSLAPLLHKFYMWISRGKTAQQFPFMFLLLSPGWYFVLFAFCFLYLWRNKQYSLLGVMLVPLLNFGTVLLGPMALVRYVLIFFWGMPLFLCFCLFKKQ